MRVVDVLIGGMDQQLGVLVAKSCLLIRVSMYSSW